MVTDVIGDARKRVLLTFPERQIYLRSGGEVTYHTLTTRTQVGVVGVAVCLLLWSLLSVLNVALGNGLFADPDKRLVEMESRYERQLADTQAKIETAELLMAEQRESFESMAASIEAKHRTLSRLAEAETLDVLGDDPLLTFADAEILVSPTLRDRTDRVARRTDIASTDIATGLPIDRSLASLADDQNGILQSAEAELLETIDFKRAVIESTGIDLDDVLTRSVQGQGGPFIPIDDPAPLMVEGEFQPRTTTIQARLYEAEALTEIVEALPLGKPVLDDSYMTSHFGIRRDPFTRRPTQHNGLDFGGRSNARIIATAPGKVVFAGWSGAYGNMVEIDHGNGFHTRYAHLRSVKVKVGQSVKEDDVVGGMGSTGRSTGTHLHYEVRYDGRARNPKDFVKAGRYVQ